MVRKKPIEYINKKKRCDDKSGLPVGLENIKTGSADHITATVVLCGVRKTFSRSYGKQSRFKRTKKNAILLCQQWRIEKIKQALIK